MDGAHRRTLERALGVVASKERLATVLEVPMHDLEAYLAGNKPLPDRVFLAALDIVANKPHRDV